MRNGVVSKDQEQMTKAEPKPKKHDIYEGFLPVNSGWRPPKAKTAWILGSDARTSLDDSLAFGANPHSLHARLKAYSTIPKPLLND